jgi:hypothetical protein
MPPPPPPLLMLSLSPLEEPFDECRDDRCELTPVPGKVEERQDMKSECLIFDS